MVSCVDTMKLYHVLKSFSHRLTEVVEVVVLDESVLPDYARR